MTKCFAHFTRLTFAINEFKLRQQQQQQGDDNAPTTPNPSGGGNSETTTTAEATPTPPTDSSMPSAEAQQRDELRRLHEMLESRGLPSSLFGSLGPRMQQILQVKFMFLAKNFSFRQTF